MDGSVFVGSNGSFLVDGFSNHIDDSAEGLGSDRDLDRIAGVQHLLASNQTFGGVEGDGPHIASSEMLGHLKDESVLGSLHLKGIEDRGQLSIELHVDDGADNLGYFSSKGSSRTE